MAEPRKLRVFLCHASQDKPIVLELYKKLTTEGWIEPWLDKDKILPGQQWQMVIEEAVESADLVIVFLSNHSVQKEGFVQRELRYASVMALEKPESTIFLIPVCIEDCQVPRSLRDLQWIDYFGAGKENSYKSLLQALGLRHQQVLELENKVHAHLETEENTRRNQLSLRARLELEERVRQDTEARIRAEYDAREKARKEAESKEQKRPSVVSAIEPPARVRDDKPVSRRGNLTYANRLNLLSMEFCRVPAGKFLLGSADSDKRAINDEKHVVAVLFNEIFSYSDNRDNDDEKPQHYVDIPYDYWLARFPVTNEQYVEYTNAAGKKHPVSDWQQRKNHPVTRVSWKDAMAYCKWLNNLLKGKLPQNYILRLPGEAEWEKAARWKPVTDGRGQAAGEGLIYPWGNTFDKNRCNISKKGTTPVGKYSPLGDSPYGCADMSGNVWEWTHSLYKPYPYQAVDGREDEKASGRRVLRGGSWAFSDGIAHCTFRLDVSIFNIDDDGGFRVAAAPAIP